MPFDLVPRRPTELEPLGMAAGSTTRHSVSRPDSVSSRTAARQAMAGGAAAAVVAFAAAANTRVGGWLGGVRRRRCCYVVQVNDADQQSAFAHLFEMTRLVEGIQSRSRGEHCDLAALFFLFNYPSNDSITTRKRF